MPIARPCKWRENSWPTCWLWTRVANPFRYARHLRPQAPRQEEESEKEQSSSRFGTSRLKRNTPSAYALTVGFVKTEHASTSFRRHADLSPDDHSLWLNTRGNLASQIPLRTHRWDESDRVFLAGCSPAVPASASSIHSAYQSFYVRSVSDPPADPCVFVDCAREFQFPIHATVCFKVGRFTLTQSSSTASTRRCSRKWMSGTLPLRWSC